MTGTLEDNSQVILGGDYSDVGTNLGKIALGGE